MKCVKSLAVDENDCLNKCDGLFITGVEKRGFEQEQVENILSIIKDDYEKYKSGENLEYPTSIGGMYV